LKKKAIIIEVEEAVVAEDNLIIIEEEEGIKEGTIGTTTGETKKAETEKESHIIIIITKITMITTNPGELGQTFRESRNIQIN
jgi:hypothetical protein